MLCALNSFRFPPGIMIRSSFIVPRCARRLCLIPLRHSLSGRTQNLMSVAIAPNADVTPLATIPLYPFHSSVSVWNEYTLNLEKRVQQDYSEPDSKCLFNVQIPAKVRSPADSAMNGRTCQTLD